MEELTVHNLLPELLRAVPEVKPLYEEDIAGLDEGEDPGLHNLFGVVFTPYWEELLRKNECKEELGRVFAFLERMVTSSDDSVDNVASVSCLEHLTDDPDVLQVAHTYMGPKSREIADELKRGWDEFLGN